MTHEEALKAASEQTGIGMWVIQTCVGAYLEARADTDDDHRGPGNPFQCEGCSADQLLADFGEER